MALKLNKKPADTPATPAASSAPNKPVGAVSKSATPAAKPASGGLSFIKRGASAKAAMAQEEHKAEQRQNKGARRFWIPKDTETEITFLDGDLVDGILDIPYIYEHTLFLNNSWDNHFICTQDQEPCPVCEGGNMNSYVGILTVIDHSEYTSQKDKKTYKDQIRKYVVKRESIKQLQQLASKCGGSLRGQRFSVSRTGDKSANVGNTFFPMKKYTPAEILATFGKDAVPINYEVVLAEEYIPADELRKLGFGAAASPVGSEPGAGGGDFSNDM